ncbi:MAG: HEAT repeat domain-containing protein [Leptospirales bacterium]|nr:HEAT repeat domain-containing protein [Leptospirales bacterium]
MRTKTRNFAPPNSFPPGYAHLTVGALVTLPLMLLLVNPVTAEQTRKPTPPEKEQKVEKKTDKPSDKKVGENAEKTPPRDPEKRKTQLESLKQRILYSSSTDRRNEIRRVRTLDESEQKEFIPILVKLCTEDLDPAVRESSMRILTEMKAKEGEPAFLAGLKDKQDDVQLAAISGIRELELKSGGEPLATMMKTLDAKKDVGKFTAIIRALGAMEYKADLTYLIAKAEDSETHEEVRRAAVLYLGDVKATEGREYLTKLAKNEEKDPDLRAYAVNSLGRMKEATAIPVIKEILESIRNQKNPKERIRMSRLRYQGMIALMRLGDRSMVPEIMSAAKDDDPSVRLRAVRQLGEMKVAEAKDLLAYKAKYDDNVRVKKAAQQALDNWDKQPAKPGSELDPETDK